MTYIDIVSSFPIILRDYLRDHASLTPLTGSRVFLDVTNAERMPLILINHERGGDKNDSPRGHVEVIYKITAISQDQQQAAIIAGTIHTILQSGDLISVLPEEWKSYYIRGYEWFLKPMYNATVKQYRSGRFYEFRLNETSFSDVRTL